ncbi:MAG: hypothetical protein EZS28_052635, partial [Streblomastix strix]
ALRPDSLPRLLNSLSTSFLGKNVTQMPVPKLEQLLRSLPSSIPLVFITNDETDLAQDIQSIADRVVAGAQTRVRRLASSEEGVRRLPKIVTEASYLGQWLLGSTVIVRSHQRFHIAFLTRPTALFPQAILDQSTLVACEAPKTLRQIISQMLDELHQSNWQQRNEKWRRLALSLSHLTASIALRGRFGRNGWRIGTNIGSQSDWIGAQVLLDWHYNSQYKDWKKKDE